MRIHHFGVKVRDVEKALHFYKEILGLDLQEVVDLGGNQFYFVGDGSVSFEIEQSFQPGDHSFDSGFSHLALQVENLQEYCQQLKQKSVRFQLEPSQFRADRKIAFIEDPEGNAIQLIEFV